jgi:hypothetical protein
MKAYLWRVRKKIAYMQLQGVLYPLLFPVFLFHDMDVSLGFIATPFRVNSLAILLEAF